MKTYKLEALIKKAENGEVSLYTRGLEMWLESIGEAYLKNGSALEMEISIEPKDALGITDSQRGYLHVLGNVAKDVLRGFGYNVQTAHDALTMVKTIPEIDFTTEVVDKSTGEVRKVPLSTADGAATAEEINRFIDNLFVWLVEQGAKPLTPDQWKKWKRWKM